MSPTLSKQVVVSRQVLERLGDQRLEEAKVLQSNGYFGAAIYLAGYSLECWLKVAICKALNWENMYGTFKTHNLELLLLHSGLEPRLQQNKDVLESFGRIQGLWPMDKGELVRYKNPDSYNKEGTRDFISWVSSSEKGVIPWIKNQLCSKQQSK